MRGSCVLFFRLGDTLQKEIQKPSDPLLFLGTGHAQSFLLAKHAYKILEPIAARALVILGKGKRGLNGRQHQKMDKKGIEMM